MALPYEISSQVTDKRRGWRLGPTRVVPRGMKIHVQKYTLHDNTDGRLLRDLTDDEIAAARRGEHDEALGLVGIRRWLEIEIASSPTEPPRAVTLHAPDGIGAAEQRFAFSEIVARTIARWASRTGSWEWRSPLDIPTGDDYNDMLFEARRARGRKKTREPITRDRLEEAARIARAHPGKPTAAVQRRLHVSRGYARRLIKLAEAAGIETVGLDAD